MSLINKMLQELDKRHAVDGVVRQSAQGDAKAMAQHLRPVRMRREFGEIFWRLMAGLMVIVACWIGWLVWQLTPHPVATELAYESVGKVRTQEPVAPAKPIEAVPAPAAVQQPAAVQPDAAPATQQAAAPEPAKIDMLRLATEITTPIPEPRARLALSRVRSRGDAKAVAGASDAPVLRTETALPAPRATPGSGRIDKRVNASPRERAEAEFRRAASFVNQGRIAEAMEGLNAALQIDPAHEAARQTAIGLLLENQRVDEAQRLLQDGLALDPGQTGFAMLLARIQVERGNLADALATLQKYSAGASASADYQGFTAALLQRLARHMDAADAYQAALRLQPASGVWWMGLGISQQALNQPREAGEAFRQAKATGNLSPELSAFVDQRLKQLQ